MANIKISELSSATLPLGGGEELPIVQTGNTVKVEIADMVTLQQIVSGNHDLIDGVNLQGTSAGVGNTGVDVNAFGNNACLNNIGSQVNAFGADAAFGNQGSEVNAFGSNAGNGNVHDNVTLFGTDTSADGPNQVVFGKNAFDEAMILDFDSLTLVRKYTYPDKSGIVALLDDIPTSNISTAQVSISALQISTMDVTPIQIVAAPGVGKMLSPIKIVFKYNANTTPFNATGTRLFYDGLGSTATSTITIINSAVDSIAIPAITDNTVASLSSWENKSLLLYNISSSGALGDGTLDVYITYETITL